MTSSAFVCLPRRIAAAALLPLLAGCAAGWSGRIESWGTLKSVLRDGDTSGRVPLGAIPVTPDSVGLGMIEGLDGEILILGTEVWQARAPTEDRVSASAGDPADVRAAFLLHARVRRWREFAVEGDLSWAQLEARLAELALTVGLGTEETWPFLVEGPLADLESHVVRGQCPFAPAPAGAPGNPPLCFAIAAEQGTLVGFYSLALPGTYTHAGSRLHAHALLSGEHSFVGHLDAVTVRAGAVIRLPVR
ncbi:MAG: acetolactate decarboxylase [Planctomycetota bacterium]